MISAFTTKMRGASEERTPTLSELCGDAAKHVAQARIALFSEAVDTDGALDHLDQAIFLLQRLSAHGRAMGAHRIPEENAIGLTRAAPVTPGSRRAPRTRALLATACRRA